MNSTLYPFPPKRDIPPPVPPKDFDITPRNKLAHKQSLPTLHRIDTAPQCQTKQRGHSSPNPFQRSWSPSPSESHSNHSASSPTRPASRLASAREKAKDVLSLSRRKGIIEPSNQKLEQVSTLPPAEHKSFKHKKQSSSTGGWRSGFFGEPLALKNEVPRCKGPMSAPIQPYNPYDSDHGPETSWLVLNRPIPPKAAAILQTPPELLQRCISPAAPSTRIRSPEPEVRRKVTSPRDMTMSNNRRISGISGSSASGGSGSGTSRVSQDSGYGAGRKSSISQDRSASRSGSRVRRLETSPALENSAAAAASSSSTASIDTYNLMRSITPPPPNRPIPKTPDVAPLIIRKESRRHHKRKKSNASNATKPIEAVTSHYQTPSAAEITSLQRHAMKQAGEFNVLSLQEVELLSQELLQLEGRCEYLRTMKQNLKQGRKTLHTRMISYLKNSRPGAFTQDNLLKQEEALADLDTAIEEWEIKLEIAEKRRVDIKEKLLEHVAAALRVVKCMPDNVERSERAIADSPPTTPEKQKRQRHEHENITVYALLADVK
ncbi:Up-regulated during septation-domain-containing protein [Pyronema omphalodes]|nr:Up-regulated during septation-domain-containing protein [Pyronema omphalodes]